MESAISWLSDITYTAELTPTPIVNLAVSYTTIGVGVKFAQQLMFTIVP